MLKFNLSILFGGLFLSWMGLSDRSNTTCQIGGLFIQIDSMLFRGPLGPIFFILDNNKALDLFENVSVLGNADDLKLFMIIKCIGDCQLFQKDLNRLSELCRSNKFDLNAVKCKSISFRRNLWPIEFVYSIYVMALERVVEIKDLGVFTEGHMSFLPHVEAIISKSSRILGFIKRNSKKFHDPYTHKTLYTLLLRPNLESLACHDESHESSF
jgi:hypothetical protein